MNAFQKIANRITTGIILGALVIGAAMLMKYDGSFQIFGYPGIAMVFFIISAIGGLYIVLSSVLKDEPFKRKMNDGK